MTDTTSDVYHEGELAVQHRAGVRQRAEKMAGIVEQSVPDSDDVHELVADQPHAVVTSVDGNGNVWTSFLTGDPGFIDIVDDRTVHFGANPATGDPLADHLRPDMPVGVLLVDPRNRNRLRLNGVVNPTDDGFTLTTAEVFPNCPKYIQKRSFDRTTETITDERTTSEGLTPAHREWISGTDTCFIGSYYPETGADASHRGGDPGFVDVDGDTIVFPDYPGNSMFCTLGNVTADSRVGLLFVNFTDDHTLQVTGTAQVVWDERRVSQYEGAERLVEITPNRTVELEDGNPLRWTLEERSPFNP